MPKAKAKLSQFRCALCGRKLPQEQYVYSRHTGNRYCLPTRAECKPRRKEKHEDQG